MSDRDFELRSTSKPPPTDPAEIHFKKAWQHRKFKRYPEAVDEFLKSLEHNPEKGATHFNLGLVYDQLSEGCLSLAHVQKALALFEMESSDSNTAAAQSLLKKLVHKYPGSTPDTQKK
jgi:tetratricopeptide (TPR) repeat protein